MPIMKNLCPHPIRYSALVDGLPEFVELKPQQRPARVLTESHEVGTVDGVPIQCQVKGDITNLPQPEPNTFFVVSSMVLDTLRAQNSSRTDILSPATGPKDQCFRNETGQIVGISRFNALNMPEGA